MFVNDKIRLLNKQSKIQNSYYKESKLIYTHTRQNYKIINIVNEVYLKYTIYNI